MKEELVSFETSHLAKEKGFSIPVCNWYHHANPSTSYLGETYSEPFDTNSHEVHNYSAPSQTILQKWLRETHEIHIEIIHFTNQPMDEEMWKDCYQVFVDSEGLHPYHKTYEKALEMGLYEALKLIK